MAKKILLVEYSAVNRRLRFLLATVHGTCYFRPNRCTTWLILLIHYTVLAYDLDTTCRVFSVFYQL